LQSVIVAHQFASAAADSVRVSEVRHQILQRTSASQQIGMNTEWKFGEPVSMYTGTQGYRIRNVNVATTPAKGVKRQRLLAVSEWCPEEKVNP
jgi:hypothetical protein